MNATVKNDDKTKAETEKDLDKALEDSFPGSDPVQLTDPSRGMGQAPKKPRPETEETKPEPAKR